MGGTEAISVHKISLAHVHVHFDQVGSSTFRLKQSNNKGKIITFSRTFISEIYNVQILPFLLYALTYVCLVNII